MNDTVTPLSALPDHRAQRRAARRAENRAEILDAAERVFGEFGLRDGSLRQIAFLSGFSTAAIYLFFDNKQHLVAETLTRRGVELVNSLRGVADEARTPLEKLHRIVDVTVAFFETHPDFRGLVQHMTGGTAIVGPILAEYAGGEDNHFVDAMTILADIVGDGQESGEVREGSAFAIAHLFSVLVNEHVLHGAEGSVRREALTADQFHGFIDGALRRVV